MREIGWRTCLSGWRGGAGSGRGGAGSGRAGQEVAGATFSLPCRPGTCEREEGGKEGRGRNPQTRRQHGSKHVLFRGMWREVLEPQVSSGKSPVPCAGCPHPYPAPRLAHGLGVAEGRGMRPWVL